MAEKNAAQAWQEFLESFGLETYDESTVPEDAGLPRITYSWADGEFENDVSLSASLWYRSMSWKDATLTALDVYRRVGRGGILITFDDGKLWIKRGSPFSQRVEDTDSTIRRILINFTVEFFRE